MGGGTAGRSFGVVLSLVAYPVPHRSRETPPPAPVHRTRPNGTSGLRASSLAPVLSRHRCRLIRRPAISIEEAPAGSNPRQLTPRRVVMAVRRPERVLNMAPVSRIAGPFSTSRVASARSVTEATGYCRPRTCTVTRCPAPSGPDDSRRHIPGGASSTPRVSLSPSTAHSTQVPAGGGVRGSWHSWGAEPDAGLAPSAPPPTPGPDRRSRAPRAEPFHRKQVRVVRAP